MGRHPSVESAQGAWKRLIDRAATMDTSLPTILIVDGRVSLPEGTALELSNVRVLAIGRPRDVIALRRSGSQDE
jgi:hypothetical protein